MRLYNEVEEATTKTVEVEDYSFFKQLFSSKKLFIALIAYTAIVVIMAVLMILDGGLIYAIVDFAIHAVICVSLWLNYLANKKSDKIETKGVNLFQIAHAIKYIILFVGTIIVIILLILNWSQAANEAKKALVQAKSKTNQDDIIAAKRARSGVFWGHLGTLLEFIIFSILVFVYFRCVMVIGEGFKKYVEKGTHFWGDLKYLSIYLFVCAGLLVGFSISLAVGFLNSRLALMANFDLSPLFGGKGWLALGARFLLAGFFVYLGLILRKGAKQLAETATSHEEEIEIEA